MFWFHFPGDALSRILDDPEPTIRSHALWALRGLDDERARAATDVALRDPDPDVRNEAAV